jgi:hypothetical protein
MRRFYALVIRVRNCVHLSNCFYLLARSVPIVASDECLLLLRVAELEHVTSKTARQISENMYCIEPIKLFSTGGSDVPCCGAGSVEFREVPGDERVKVFRCVGRRKSASAINFNIPAAPQDASHFTLLPTAETSTDSNSNLRLHEGNATTLPGDMTRTRDFVGIRGTE